MGQEPIIEYQNINKVYGENVAVEDINLKIYPGDFVCFIGTSGSGKTTLMRMVNHMLKPTNGTLLFKGKDISTINPIELRRRIGYVIQNIGLMPHMTIYENIVLVPKLLKWSEEAKRAKARELIKLVELPEEYLDRYPSELSGGQQQRIGVIRALAADQDIILMDEPFGALDPITREGIQDLVKSLQEEMGKTIILVTHDMDEALKLATKIIVMDNGKMVQEGTAITLMRQKRVDSLLVTDNGKLIGFIDLESLSSKYKKDRLVSDILKHTDFYVMEDDLLRNTAERILKLGLKYAPVVDHENNLKGIVTRASLVDMLYDIIWGDTETEDQ